MTLRSVVKNSRAALIEKGKVIKAKLAAALAGTTPPVQTLPPQPLHISSPSTTRPIAPPAPLLSASDPKLTHSQVISNLFEIMPSQIRRDLILQRILLQRDHRLGLGRIEYWLRFHTRLIPQRDTQELMAQVGTYGMKGCCTWG